LRRNRYLIADLQACSFVVQNHKRRSGYHVDMRKCIQCTEGCRNTRGAEGVVETWESRRNSASNGIGEC
jgi:hypothetical protein